jgi:hypothetical protein
VPTNADQTAIDEIAAFNRQKDTRGNFDSMFEEIARYVLPRAQNFISKTTPGTRRDQYIFDSTAPLALPRFAAAMESLTAPRTEKWHALRPVSEKLQDNEEVALYLERKRDLLFRIRYSRQANFAGQIGECYTSLGAFGTMGMFIEDGLSRGPLYQSIPLSQLYIDEDAQGRVDTVRRKYTLTVRQAIQKFGKDNLPEEITKFQETDAGKEFEFLHVVRPNGERKADVRDFRGMKIAAFDICITCRCTIRRGGYRTMPYAISRYTVAPGEVYGRSVMWDAFSDIKTLNEQAKTALRYGQRMLDPPWLTADVDSLSPFSVQPGAINPGYLDSQGRSMAQSLVPSGDPRVAFEVQERLTKNVNTSALITLFQILVDTPRMTATEALLRAQEKGALLAPTVGRQQSEFFDPLIHRELDIMENAGLFDDMPEALAAEGGMMDVVYDSPLTRAQMAEEGVGIMRTLEAAGQLAQYDDGESIKDIDTGWTLRKLAKINGAPVQMMKSAEVRAAEKAQEAEQAQMANILAAANSAANTAKTGAEAANAASAAPF